ncbi:sensor histidine kinase [Cohnella endophytica]|uniref:Sensor histidine kinase n=1 Tax=Cohnella endophytica TaxID=2419778 RepID=A0A494XKK0_9BACL|nr:sensor histidine kinase [Cohnella endophytica]RKP48063.1 sensor histidine kinase [Cohnella endophytica]
MKLGSRLLISNLILIALPLIVLGTLFYRTSLNVVTKQAQQNVYQIVKKSNEVMDTKLNQIEADSMTLFADKELFDIFNRLDPTSQYELLQADRKISAILSRQFSQQEDLYTYQIWTSYYAFGSSRTMPQGEPAQTLIYREAVEAGGKMVWYPTYDFVEMFNLSWLKTANYYDYRYLFSATRLLNFSHLENSTMMKLNPGVERPVLTINLKADLFRSLFERSIPADSTYFVIAPNGKIVAHSDSSKLTTTFEDDWVRPLLNEGTGTQKLRLDGKNRIVCFDRSKVTGWLSVVVIPETALVDQIVPSILTSTLSTAILLGLVAVTLAFFVLRRITDPIKKLMAAMRFVGEGDFQTRVEPAANDEFGILIRKFNNMNNRIQLLINENYEIKMKEQEAEIQALNLQMNPHFLYNTLNVMNWMAIENQQKELSKMLVCLSNMLHYTVSKDWDLVHLSEEIEWLNNYFHIMSMRFEGKFEVRYAIQPDLYAYKVPRLLFQPFVENAILHGFDQMEDGGVIVVSGRIENDRRVFAITDNGRGIGGAITSSNNDGKRKSVGIGNIRSRIRLQYGEEYGVEIHPSAAGGTIVEILLPLDSAETQGKSTKSNQNRI